VTEPKNPTSGTPKTGAPKRASLDLGLGGIIGDPASDSTSPTSQPNPASPRPTPLKEPARDAPIAPVSRSEYATLADQGRWAELLELTEQRTAGGGRGELAPRFWWVRASVALGTVPLSILSAPLDSVSAELAAGVKRGGAGGGAELAPVAAALLADVSSRLVTNTDFAGAVTFAERAFRLDGRYRGVLEDVVGTVLRLPVPSARRDPGGARVRATCERLRDELGLVMGAPSGERSAPPTELRREPTVKRAAPQKSVPPAGEDGAAAAAPVAPATKSGGLVSLVAFFALIGGLVWYLRGESGLQPVTLEGETSLAIELPVSAPVIAPPPIERMAKVSQLAAVFYDFDRGVVGGEPRAESRRAAPQRQDRAVVGGRERVDTTGPVEPPEVLKARTYPEEPTEEDVSSILFGVPKPSFPAFRGDRLGAQVPKPVEQFSTPRTYVVRVKTRVVSRPSLSGVSVAELAAGDTVSGEGLVGDWLKIRSRNGQVGYILAQDVSPRG